MSFFSDKTPPSFDKKINNYEIWKKKFSIWQNVTDIDDTKQGGMVVLNLDEETQAAIFDAVTCDDITS